MRATIAAIADWFTVRWIAVRDRLTQAGIVDGYDFNFITTTVATGAAVVDHGFVEALKRAGITHIIDVTDAEDDRALLPANFPYLYNPTADDGSHKPVEWFHRSLSFALPVLSGVAPAKVYAHCSAGINRGPSTAYAIIRAQGLTETTALKLFSERRPQARIGYRADAEAALKALGYKV